MSHASWIYGWWALPYLSQAHAVAAETALLVAGYIFLAAFALTTRHPGAGDPAQRMMEEDEPPEGDPSS